MWKSMRARTAMWALCAALVAGAAPAGAVTYEDSFDQCNYPKGFDLVVMRPISFGTMILGAVLFVVPAAPIAALAAPKEIGDVWDFMVGESARFTFKRQLGECTGVDLSY